MINEESLNYKARKRIMLLIICGFLVIVADSITSNISSVKMVSSGGNYYLVRPDDDADAGHISLNAEIETKGENINQKLNLTLSPYKIEAQPEDGSTDTDGADESSKEELIAYEIRSISNSLNEDTSVRNIKLPSRLSTGEKINWSRQRSTNTVPILFGMIIMAFLIYRERFAPLKKIREEKNNSVSRQLPEFINRIVLLLNAGLVLNHAFEMAVAQDNYSSKDDYFYGKMHEIQSRIDEANSSLTREFSDFARAERSSDSEIAKELMRISNIFNDNISKGVELTSKLQSESETLWLNRKRNCEERGHIAETKQTLPLTLLLLVLIVITVSPALLEL